MIVPFDPEQLQPASYDCKLATTFKVPQSHRAAIIDLRDPQSFRGIMETIEVGEEESFIIHPHKFVLGSSREWFNIPLDVAARVEGKSSLGRIFLMVHATAGFIDPGFKGVVTFEFLNFFDIPIRVRPMDLIAQMSFFELTSPSKGYQGRYQGDRTTVASRYGMEKPGGAQRLPT